MVNRIGAGPAGFTLDKLTPDRLEETFYALRSESYCKRAKKLGELMRKENGVHNGISSFYRNLPVNDMLCEVSLFAKRSCIAKVYCRDCDLKMTEEIDSIVHSKILHHSRFFYRYALLLKTPPFMSCFQSCVNSGTPPSSLLQRITREIQNAASELVHGLQPSTTMRSSTHNLKLPYKPETGISRNFIARPNENEILVIPISDHSIDLPNRYEGLNASDQSPMTDCSVNKQTIDIVETAYNQALILKKLYKSHLQSQCISQHDLKSFFPATDLKDFYEFAGDKNCPKAFLDLALCVIAQKS